MKRLINILTVIPNFPFILVFWIHTIYKLRQKTRPFEMYEDKPTERLSDELIAYVADRYPDSLAYLWAVTFYGFLAYYLIY